MIAEDVKALLTEAFPSAQINVAGEGAKFDISMVSDDFTGKRAVARQQMVYAVLNDQIASGEIHAVTMSLKTTTEAE
ncbi:BolA family protein [Reinekea sp. G2M2-21]|uniref:BolA family protein n=1 Tax=Reinekea sp. G2M2-21 TaxID=2788942 RepID=UPI0018AA8076|nr:BolA/IbaG family iron-sulfur metabolism protein [Reinekea sp. G2M2-21]